MKTNKKTDKNKVEKLFLYCLGTSPAPMSISEIEDAIEVKNPPYRQNYVYEVKKRLHHDSPYLPSNLVFTEDDFLSKQSGEFDLEKDKFRNKVFEVYKNYFKCESKYDLKINTPEKEDKNKKKIKCIQISDYKNNYIRVEINFTDLSETKILKKDQIKFFQKSRFSDIEIELYLYARREKGRLVIRNYKLIPNFYFLDCIDMISSINGEKYVLNLRGLLYLFLLYDGKLDVASVEKIISNVSSIDEYMNLRDEIDLAYGSVTSIKYAGGKPHDVERIFGSTTSHRIKNRFPFLSFYDDYKDYIHTHNERFISDFLLDVAQDFERQLRNMSITKMKYEVTKRYLKKIRKYFYSFNIQRLVHANLSDNTFQAIAKLQEEIGVYIEEMKRNDYEWEKLERQMYEKECKDIEFSFKFNTLTNSDQNVISLKQILLNNDNGRVIPNKSQVKIIERFCKYGKEENESYSPLLNHSILITNSLLKELALKVNKNNSTDNLLSELDRNGIPRDCVEDVGRCINENKDSLNE